MGFTEQHHLVGKAACRRILAYHSSYISFKVVKNLHGIFTFHTGALCLSIFSHPIKELQ